MALASPPMAPSGAMTADKIPAARYRRERPRMVPLDEFGKAASVPMLINTSLNINEQPTVNSPLEALHTYFCSGLDVLFLGPYRLSKPN